MEEYRSSPKMIAIREYPDWLEVSWRMRNAPQWDTLMRLGLKMQKLFTKTEYLSIKDSSIHMETVREPEDMWDIRVGTGLCVRGHMKNGQVFTEFRFSTGSRSLTVRLLATRGNGFENAPKKKIENYLTGPVSEIDDFIGRDRERGK